LTIDGQTAAAASVAALAFRTAIIMSQRSAPVR
jgi:hypothetical protein